MLVLCWGFHGSQEILGPTWAGSGFHARHAEGRCTGGAAGPVPGERGALAEPLSRTEPKG